MMKFPLRLSKTWVWLLLAAGLAACTGATEPAEPTSLPVETEDVRPEQTTEAALQKATQAVEAPTDTPLGPTPSPDQALPDLVLPDLGQAPDFTNEVWLNTETPLNLETLRGKVVLVEFWTFG
jgi:hypothetical protein